MCPDSPWAAVFAVNIEKCACAGATDMIRATSTRKNILPFYVKLTHNAMMMIIITHPSESARASEISCEVSKWKQTRMFAVDTRFKGPLGGGGKVETSYGIDQPSRTDKHGRKRESAFDLFVFISNLLQRLQCILQQDAVLLGIAVDAADSPVNKLIVFA